MTIEQLFALAELIQVLNVIFGVLFATGLIIFIIELSLYLHLIDFSFFDPKPACITIIALILLIGSFSILVYLPAKYDLAVNKTAVYIQQEEEKNNSEKVRSLDEIRSWLKANVRDSNH